MGYFDNKAGSLIEAATSVKNKTIEAEGNKFTKALMAARENGDKIFSVNGKQYRTEDLDKLDIAKIKDVIKQLKGAVKAHQVNTQLCKRHSMMTIPMISLTMVTVLIKCNQRQ